MEKVAAPEKKSKPVKKQKPEPVKKVQPVQRTGDCSLVNNYNWDKRVAYAVCMAESGGNPMATNMNDNHGSCRGSYGLMQLACFWISNPYDPTANMDKAYEIYQKSGWKPWGAYTSGSYMRYM